MKDKTYSTSEAIKFIFKNSLFIMFSFVNLFLPFYATIISSLNGPNGILYVIASGLSTSFITIFNQFLFLLALAIIFVYKQMINKDNSIKIKNIKESLFIVFIFSIIAIILFIATSFVYINFSVAYANLSQSINFGFEYILVIAFSLLFNGFIYFEIMNIHIFDKKELDD